VLLVISPVTNISYGSDQQGIPTQTDAITSHAVTGADGTFYTIHVVERLQKNGVMGGLVIEIPLDRRGTQERTLPGKVRGLTTAFLWWLDCKQSRFWRSPEQGGMNNRRPVIWSRGIPLNDAASRLRKRFSRDTERNQLCF